MYTLRPGDYDLLAITTCSKYYYAGTSLSCAGIQRWKSVSFHCWTAINLVGELRRRRKTPHPLPTPPLNGHPELVNEQWRGGGRWPPPPTHPPSQWAVKSSAFLLSFLTVSCEEFYILAWSLFTLGRCGETLYCSAGILRPQGFGLFTYSNVNLPCNTDFLYHFFFSNYNLKVSKIGSNF